MPQITKLSKEKYEAIKNIQPDNIDDRLFLHRISEAVKLSEDNIHMVWLSKDYNDYTRIYRGMLLKARCSDPDFVESLLMDIQKLLERQNELLEQIVKGEFSWKIQA